MLESRTLYIPEYLHSTTDIFVPLSLDKKISELPMPTVAWLYKSIKLGLMMEESEVYQEVGVKKDMLKLSVDDNRPYPLISSEESYEINIPQKYINRIQKCLGQDSYPDNINKWIRKTFYLGLNHQEMKLFQKNPTGYEIIKFRNIDVSDIK